MQRLAEILNYSIACLLGHNNIRNESISATLNKVNSALTSGPELLSFWQELSKRDDLKMLMRQVRDLPPKEVKRIIRLIKAVEDEEAAEEF